MTRIDTSDIARFWLAGSQQGIGMSQSAAQREMADRQFQFNQDRAAFGEEMDLRQMNLAEQRFGLDIEQAARQSEMDQLRMQAVQEERDRRLNTARTLASITRRRLSAVRGARANAQAAAMMMGDGGTQQQLSPTGELMDLGRGGVGLAGMAPSAERPGALMQGGTSGTAMLKAQEARAPRVEVNPFTYDPAQDPAERDFERAITAAEAMGDVEALEVLSDAIDDDVKRRTILEQGRQMVALVGDWKFISPKAPQLRAIARAAAMVGDHKRVFEIFEQDADELGKMTPDQIVVMLNGLSNGKITPEHAQLYTDMYMRAFGRDASEEVFDAMRRDALAMGRGGEDGAEADPSGVADAFEKAAVAALRTQAGKKITPEQRSRFDRLMTAAAAARANPANVLPDGRVVMNDGKPGRNGAVRIVGLDGSEQGLSPRMFAEMVAPQLLATEMGTEETQALTEDVDSIIDRMIGEGASDEEIAAELQRAGFTLGD